VAGIMHPLDLIKTRFQSTISTTQGHDGKSNAENQVPKYEGIVKGIKEIYRTEGFKGLYKGFYISLLSQAMATALFFWMYLSSNIDTRNKKNSIS
jgi:hypothetical protein